MASVKQEEAPEFICMDCKMDVGDKSELFAVHKGLWYKVVKGEDRNKDLCVGCLEERIGRRLRPEDFPDWPINTDYLLFRSHRLIDRMSWIRDYW